MGARKETLGYPSRTEAVLALRSSGLATAEIAQRIGILPATVVALEHSAARSRRRMEAREAEAGRAVLLPNDVFDKLARHAAKRNMAPHKLARLIVAIVVDDDMVEAVLDDECDPEGWA